MTDELKELYTYNHYGVIAFDTIVMSHPDIPTTYLIADDKPHTLRLEDGPVHTFEPFAFSVVSPDVGSNQQDLAFVFDNVYRVGTSLIEAASKNIMTPIQLDYRVYVEGDDTPQSEKLTLFMTDISVTGTSISGRASRTDLFARKIPNRFYESWVFKGLL